MRLLVIVLAVLAASTAAVAQEKAWRLGVLTPGRETRGAGSLFSSTLPVLAERGFVEGRNLEVIIAAAEGDPARLPSLAAALADARPDAIITIGTQATDAALAAAPRTPIVLSFAGQDPVETGHARSLARPGGRVTGIFFRAVETDAKRLELLVEAIPDAKHFGFLAAPTLEPARAEFLARTAERLGVVLTTRTATGPADFPAVFAALQEAGTVGVLVQATTL
ncbi:MAG TPA: ABC transporter substrate binding protein, partial [Sphingomonas sp.]|nr:ABC transporter substrate binding protein [Sphingomonas sp.]